MEFEIIHSLGFIHIQTKLTPNKVNTDFVPRSKGGAVFAITHSLDHSLQGKKENHGFSEKRSPSQHQVSMPTPQRMNASILDKMGGDIYFEI